MFLKPFFQWIGGGDAGNAATNEHSFIVRQMFDRESCTYTYLLGDLLKHDAVLIDPVFELAERDRKLVDELGLQLKFAMNTHVHADHITGSGILKKLYGHSLQSIISFASGADADQKVNHGDAILFGRYSLEVRSTPGHTPGCVCYVFNEGRMIFTGDSLLIRGCGRTDFQGGSSERLYESIHSQIFTLPDNYTVFPGHDYKGGTCSTIGEEKLYNYRLNGSLNEFTKIMDEFAIKHPPPKMLDTAVPANRVCGLWNLPPELQKKLDSAKK